MSRYYGNYLGLCVNNDDPEKRGRVQVFIPHIMPSLYEDWNSAEEDIRLLCVGNNLPNSLREDTVKKLIKILPWCESAMPILGSSSSGHSIITQGNFNNQSPVPDPAGAVGGGAYPYVVPPDGAGGGGVTQNHEGKDRDGPLGADLVNVIATGLAGTGLNWESTSGTGTTAKQSSGSFHQTGQATDGVFRDAVTGNILDANNLEDRGRIAFALNKLTAAGIGGVGWGPDYMGSQTFHLDIGPGGRNWGSSYSSDTAASWIISARNGGGTAQPTGYERQSLGVLPAASPLQNPNPAGQDPNAFNYNSAADPRVIGDGVRSVAGGSGGGLLVDQNGQVNASQLESEILKVIQSNPSSIYNNGLIPANGESYGLDGSAQSWASFYKNLAGFESTFNNVPFIDDINGVPEPGGSGGLFQLGRDQIEIWADEFPSLAQTYGFQQGVDYSEQDYLNPNFNMRGMLFIGEALLSQNYAVGPGQGLGRTIGSLSWEKLANGVDPGGGAENAFLSPETLAGAAATQLPVNLVQNPDPHGTTAVLDMNNMTSGAFSYPGVGAVLWCFFREGNPLFPVYFAASYGQSEWASAYRYPVSERGAEPGPSYKPSTADGNPVISIGGILKLGPGAIRWEDTTVPDNPTKDQKSLMIAGHDGSNMFFNEGYHQIFSQFDRRDQVDGDRWEVTMGQKEQWVQGTYNLVVIGDFITTVGNAGPTAGQALENIKQSIDRIEAPLYPPKNFCTEEETQGSDSFREGETVTPNNIAESQSTIGAIYNPNVTDGVEVVPSPESSSLQEQIALYNARTEEYILRNNLTTEQADAFRVQTSTALQTYLGATQKSPGQTITWNFQSYTPPTRTIINPPAPAPNNPAPPTRNFGPGPITPGPGQGE